MNNKGNALIGVLVIIVLLSSFILGFLHITTSQYKHNSRQAHLTTLRWGAQGALNKFLNDILTYKLVMSDTFIEDKINGCSYSLKLNKQEDNLFQIKVDAEKQGIKYSLSRPMKMEFLSDYLFYVNGDFQAAPVENKYSLYGSLFIEKTFLIRTQPQGEILFFFKKNSSHPLISTGKKIVYTGYKDLKSTIKLGFGKSKDNIDEMFVLINKGELSGELPKKYLQEKIRSDFDIPPVETIFNNYKENAFLHIKETKGREIKKIVNKYLLEKEVIGTGNNRDLTFKLKDKKVKNIYFKKINTMQEYIKVNPFYDVDTKNTAKHFTVQDNKLILDPEDKRYRLDLPENELVKLNMFPYITDTISFSAKDRKIRDVYLGNKKLYVGNQYEINEKSHSIYFYSPDFTKLLGTGNGLKKEFALKDLPDPLIIFKNRMRAYDFTLKGNKVVFSKAPGYKEKIYYYKQMPEIYITKAVPEFETAVCIDKEIECVEINLNKMDFPGDTVIVSDVPLYIYGRSKNQMAFIVKDDVYLGNINGRGAVSIFSRLIWLDFNNKDEIKLDNLYLFTEGETLYSINFNKNSRKIINGAMTFLCKHKPFTRAGGSVEKSFFYKDDYFFNGYFKYNDEFAKSPPLCAPFKILSYSGSKGRGQTLNTK